MNDSDKRFYPGGGDAPATAIPTPAQVATKALAPIYFEWNESRILAEEAVAKAIEEERQRVRHVVARARILMPAILRDLDVALGGRLK